MADIHTPTPSAADGPLGDLVCELIDCGGVLSQMVADMLAFEAAGHCTDETLPVGEAMYAVILSALAGLRHRFSRRDLGVAARIVKQATDAMCSEIFVVDPDRFGDPNDN